MFCFHLCLLFQIVCYNAVEADPPCRTPNNEIGKCIIIEKCTALYFILQKRPLSSADANFLRQSQCGFVGLVPMVCCPPTTSSLPTLPASTSNPFTSIPVNTEESNEGAVPSNLLPDKFTCGRANFNKIFGGEVAELDEFPWMALIEYEKPNRQRGFYCGGVLITKRYVLTASHCLKGKDLPKNLKLVSVRLGEYDTEQDRDCVTYGKTECSDPPVNVPVEERIAHEKYDPMDINQYYDIALLRLIRDVQYTDYVRPICLPTLSEERKRTYNGMTLTVAGWGLTENRSSSSIKLKVLIPVMKLSQCKALLSKARKVISDEQICAGGEENKSSCRGDSGGPLMSLSVDEIGLLNWYLAGIVSYGPIPCGFKDWPSVYTRVSKYMGWILKHIEP
ncbi:CLIP domain-containing serine protease 2-like [Harmonia axyridis]|uniref:CLIP domain-containing serine protease 2-like n=1 Tax=Harmonia axyridis TaxID=115357 RepID=UPI001E275C4F|nr:CLIP domain-containing serine protease 2-like [Harmonia axyridis]XP_045461311.1 CLIP domain-containing serine protease 2-like [Harmonia axyridis]